MLDRIAYLNAGTFGPLARSTVEAMSEQASRELEAGRVGEAYYASVRERRDAVRAALAGVLGVEAGSIALTSSTTSGCAIVCLGLGLGPEDEVVTTDDEHFGLLGPLHASTARVRVAQTRARPPEEAFAAILGDVGPRTRLLALSHVSWMTGNLLPVAELKEETGLPMLVDGAQTAGAILLDVGAFDFYAVSGQKWLCGPDGTGALHVAEPERLRVAAPSHWSRSAHEPDGSFTPRSGAARFDAGSMPSTSLAGLEAALADAPAWRFERALATAARCRDVLAEGHEVVTAPGQSTLVTFRPHGDAAETARHLSDSGVVLREVPETGWLRVSCGYWTSDEDLERLLAAIGVSAAAGGGAS